MHVRTMEHQIMQYHAIRQSVPLSYGSHLKVMHAHKLLLLCELRLLQTFWVQLEWDGTQCGYGAVWAELCGVSHRQGAANNLLFPK